MNTITLSCPFLPSTLNEIISIARQNKYASAQLKRKWHKRIAPFVTELPNIEGKVYLECVWFIKNRRRDQDNITSAQKYILDCLVEQQRIEDDNLRIIQSPIIHHFIISDFDGFSIVIRDEESFRERMFEDISNPPKEAFEFLTGSTPTKSPEKRRTYNKRRVLRRKQPFTKQSYRR
jgi:Holliday junction resolvase RusA-like endonuclease